MKQFSHSMKLFIKHSLILKKKQQCFCSQTVGVGVGVGDVSVAVGDGEAVVTA